MNNNTRYQFKPYVYQAPYAPYFDRYKDHSFSVDHFMMDEGVEVHDHVWLKCVDNPAIAVNGYVHLTDLQVIP